MSINDFAREYLGGSMRHAKNPQGASHRHMCAQAYRTYRALEPLPKPQMTETVKMTKEQADIIAVAIDDLNDFISGEWEGMGGIEAIVQNLLDLLPEGYLM